MVSGSGLGPNFYVAKQASPWQLASVKQLYPAQVNPVLQAAGVRSLHEFTEGLTAFLGTVREMKDLARVADKHGCTAVLSGGTALKLVLAYIQQLKEGKKPPREVSLRTLLEGSDVDGLVLARATGDSASPNTVKAISDELNKKSGAELTAKLPSVERRYYALEWDLQDAKGFYELNRTYGGESIAQMGLGLDSKGELVMYDPNRALAQLFGGYFEYAVGTGASDESMVRRGQMDPALDGLRIIRAVGQVDEFGVQPSENTLAALKALGSDSHDRLFQIQAGYHLIENGKLERRWKKYVDKIFTDHRDPGVAMKLIEQSGYGTILTALGLQRYLQSPLPASRPDSKGTSAPATRQWIVKHRMQLLKGTRGAPAQLYLWASKKRADALAAGNAIYQQNGGKMGPGLYLSGDAFPDKGTASVLLRTTPNPSAKLLNLSEPSVAELVHAYLEVAKAEFMPAPTSDVLPQLDAEADAKSAAFGFLLTELGLDGAVEFPGLSHMRAVLNNAAPLNSFERQYDFQDGLVRQLRNGQLGERTELGARGLIALKGIHGLDEVINLVERGTIHLESLFPKTETKSLFEEVPFVSKEAAASLERKMKAEGDKLNANQKKSMKAAIAYLNGELPDDGSKAV